MPRQNRTAPTARSRSASMLIAIALTAALGGCQEYLDRSDTITLGVADATENNKAVHTITRWPKASRHDRWRTDGERSRTAIARYRANKVIPPRTLSGKVGAGSSEAPVAATDMPIEAGPSDK